MPKINFRLYLVTNRNILPANSLIERVEVLVNAGIRAVQLREKDLPTKKQLELAQEIKNKSAQLFINERADIAYASEATGLHLPEHGLSVHEARKIIGNKIIGKSTHSIVAAFRAEEEGADFITFGPIYDTLSKREYGAPLGIRNLQETAKKISIPIFAIGGINPERAKECLNAGAFGISVISDLLVTPNPVLQVKKYVDALGYL